MTDSAVLVKATVTLTATALATFSVAAITVSGLLLRALMTAAMLVISITFYLTLKPFSQEGPKCHGEDDCCEGQCGEGEGDCDWDSDCAGFLVCGSANCVGQGFEDNDDCCEKP